MAYARERNEALVFQRQLHNWTQEHLCEEFYLKAYELGMNLPISPREVRRWESGEIRTPRPDYRRVLEALFGIPIQQLGFHLPVPANLPGVEQPWTQNGLADASVEVARRAPLDRRNFVVLTGGTLSSSVLASMREPEPFVAALKGGRVTTSLVKTIEKRTDTLRHLDAESGGGYLLAAVAADLQLAAELIKNSSYTGAVGRRLYVAMAELAALAGWVYFDVGRHAAAQQYYLVGLRAAHAARDPALGSYILADMSYQASLAGQPDDGINLAHAALSSAKQSRFPPVHALACGRLALAHGRAGDSKACAGMISQALNAPAKASGPKWSFWITQPAMTDLVGTALLATGDYVNAIDHLSCGRGPHGKSIALDRAFYLSQLAIAHVRQRNIEQACAVGTQALGFLPHVNSPRIISEIRGLHRELTRYQDTQPVREFANQAYEKLA